jgi:hypothetical protein
MFGSKLANHNRDLAIGLKRFNIEFNFHPRHPLKTDDGIAYFINKFSTDL